MNELLVSIIINNCNYAAFLKSAIDSALSQTYVNIEVVVVDDGSTDNSRKIIHSYGDKIIPIFKTNGGQASALNAGFAISRGELIIFLDADDVLLPELVEQLVKIYLEQSDLSKVQYQMEVIDAANKPTGIIKPHPHLPMLTGNLCPYLLSAPFDVACMPTSGNAFSAKILRQIFPIPEAKFTILADYYLGHIAPLFGPVCFLEKVGAYYRLHGSNNYEVSQPGLNLRQIRQNIIHSCNTLEYIIKYARQSDYAGYSLKKVKLLSVVCQANQLVSLKLDQPNHPVAEDTVFKLCWGGLVATWKRRDVWWLIKLFFFGWFFGMWLAPRPLALHLAEWFFFPEKRQRFNRLLRILHRPGYNSRPAG